jgi:hypothetical protein
MASDDADVRVERDGHAAALSEALDKPPLVLHGCQRSPETA